MPSVEPVVLDRHFHTGDPQLISALSYEWAAADGYPLHAIESPRRTADQITSALDASDTMIIARRTGDTVCGYGRLLGWTETDGTDVRLLDTYSAPGADRAAIEIQLLTQLEQHARQELHSGSTVLAANAEVDDAVRVGVLERLGYRRQFDVIEMELVPPAASAEIPPGVAIRTADPDDAQSIAGLTAVNWAGRPYFSGLDVDSVRAWLRDSDRDLFLLAETMPDDETVDHELIGMAVAVIGGPVVEIDDLGVRPQWRRRGLATGLMGALLARVTARSSLPVRLLTEGADPSGARRLYQRLGFRTAARHGRFRKQPV